MSIAGERAFAAEKKRRKWILGRKRPGTRCARHKEKCGDDGCESCIREAMAWQDEQRLKALHETHKRKAVRNETKLGTPMERTYKVHMRVGLGMRGLW